MKQQIDQKYLKQHTDLEIRYYKNREIPKEEFDRLHGELWENHRNELIGAGLLTPPAPQRDLEAEMDDLKARIKKLEGK